jgi:outer membrane receptor protein involved in Fe transport
VKYDNGRTRLGLDAQIVGERFSDQANSIRVDGYLVLNAEARQRLSPNLTLTLAGKNLLNRVYQTWKDYVMPPLSFWVGAELRL